MHPAPANLGASTQAVSWSRRRICSSCSHLSSPLPSPPKWQYLLSFQDSAQSPSPQRCWFPPSSVAPSNRNPAKICFLTLCNRLESCSKHIHSLPLPLWAERLSPSHWLWTWPHHLLWQWNVSRCMWKFSIHFMTWLGSAAPVIHLPWGQHSPGSLWSK